ncbi:FAD-dependent monooxygenase [Agrobacterium fabrum]|uniref:FAD-dependent monooxygenase n=1 Tax=Agrobacterium fabrum TaxID=1176649 RepID=UPI0024731626|nr:FAD-dependent monooxygenase [Agrobacterium fabrum]MDH6298705.1 2-polyprenyl-6-methoxyphenol hydroxylase-like FAD-dependent oxidoreductase [Agrobacterium fabrum]
MSKADGFADNRPKILIVGSSIAGPTAAFWLVRAGFNVTIVEQASELRRGGNGVDVRSEALAVIERMGLTSAIRAKALSIKGLRFVDHRDRERARMPLEAMERMVGSEDLEIKRGDLAELLFDATKNDVNYIFGETVKTIAQDERGVDVTFTNGSPRRFDLVIGADGLHSGVRRAVFGAEDEFLKFKQHYFAFANVDLPMGEHGWVTFYNEPGKSAAIFRAEPGLGQINFMFHSDRPLSYNYRDLAKQRALLREAFSSLGWHVPAMLEETDSAVDFYFDALAQVQMPSWSSGRVVLVGDAAYCASPASGAGALLALTGAYRLAGELATYGITATALERYEVAQRPLVAQKQEQLFTWLSTPRTRFGIVVRNWLLSPPLNILISKLQGSDGQASIHEYRFPNEASLQFEMPRTARASATWSPETAGSSGGSA